MGETGLGTVPDILLDAALNAVLDGILARNILVAIVLARIGITSIVMGIVPVIVEAVPGGVISACGIWGGSKLSHQQLNCSTVQPCINVQTLGITHSVMHSQKHPKICAMMLVTNGYAAQSLALSLALAQRMLQKANTAARASQSP